MDNYACKVAMLCSYVLAINTNIVNVTGFVKTDSICTRIKIQFIVEH